MKKKVFSLMMMLLLAFIGVAKAEVVEIGTGTSTTYQFPVNSLYKYSFTEMIYSAEEIGTAGTIYSVAFHFNGNNVLDRSVVMYMKNVDRSTFSSSSDYEDVTSADLVFTGTLSSEAVDGWVTLTLDSPFVYDGYSNLMIAFDDNTGSWSSRYFYYTTAASTGLCYYSDTYDPDPYELGSYSGSKTVSGNRPNVQIDMTPGGGGQQMDKLHVKYVIGEEEIIDSLNMGVRPAGAWMEPFNFIMYTDGPAYTVSVLDFTPNDHVFSVSGQELPFQVLRNHDVELIMDTDGSQEGLFEAQFVAITEGDRGAHLWPLVVELYSPERPDVWELAQPVNSYPYVNVPATMTTLHNDYTLPFPEIEEGLDAVYKLTFNEDQVLNAYVSYGENGKVAIYREGFEGEGGPMATNNYTGIHVGSGGASGSPFEAQIGEGTSTTGYFPFYTLYNYSIATALYTAAELTEAGANSAPMSSLSFNANNSISQDQNNIKIWMANVTDTEVSAASPVATGMTLVYEGNLANPTPTGWIEFDFNQGTFSWDGSSNVLILCQRNNGSWTSSIQWQAHNPGFYGMGYLYNDNSSYSVETTSYSLTRSNTARPNIIMKADGRRNRDEALTFDFEDQQIPADWNNGGTYPWTVVADNGSYVMKSSNGGVASSNSTVSATYELLSDGSISFDALCMGEGSSTYWDHCDFYVDNTRLLYAGANISGWNHYSFDVTAGEHTFTWSYTKDGSVNPTGDYFMVDNVTIIGMGEPIPEPEPVYSWGPVIEGLPVTPGTYYLVASSTTPDFEVTINAEDMPCPEYAVNPVPADGEYEVEPAHVTLRWQLDPYTTEYRLRYGRTYYCEDILVDWTSDLANSYTVNNLMNNTQYFWCVDQRNSSCETEGEIWGFTTHFNIPQNLYAEDETIFNDEQVILHWTAVQDRTYRNYYIYRDGERVGETTTNQIDLTTYVDGPLAYNMEGYTYYVTAFYDEGESAPSNTVNVKVSGRGNVNGHVYEQDGETGVAGATVTMIGQDEFGDTHTYDFQTDVNGYYVGSVYAGSYNGQAAKEGYQTITAPVQGNPIDITYNETTSPIDYMLDENFDPVCTVIAQYYPDSTDINAPYVKVSWGCGLPGEEIIEPFETGDFSLFDWQLDPSYPWTVTTTNPYEGQYCMKSGGAGVANVVSNMTVTVNIPADGLMSFFGKISSENNWDYGYFYIDGNQMGSYTGAGTWSEKTFDITAGDHTFQWRYTKDGSVNSNDDCFYVDYINFYKRPEPAIPGMTYDFENSTMQGWTSVDADGDGYGWYVASEIMSTGYGHNGSNDCVLSQSYNNSVGVLYPDNYLVSPQVQLGGIIRFYACAQDASYAAEHFGVAVSTTNTNPSSFTMLQEWTMSAKSMGEGKPVTRNTRSGRAQGSWYEYTVDLSAYSGMGYVAIRHFNCSDMFYLDVDDITIGEPGKGMPNNNRTLSHYRVYRTNCYNDGPYTEENTELLATVWMPDTVYIDVSWPYAAPGVYKWGVGTVYSGNRGEMIEGPISWGQPMALNRDVTAENAPNPVVGEYNGNRAPWDLMHTFYAAEGGQYGVVTDGNYIYTSNWGYSGATYNFYKYDMQGNVIEGFNVSGCGTLRGMTYDGQYVYGVANSSTVYCVDLDNHTLVSTFTSSYGAMRCISYDPQRDGFWVVGNWSGNLTLIDRTGAIVTAGPAPSSASDVAYYKDENNDEHVFCFDNGTNLVWDYNIAANSIVGTVFDFSVTPGFSSSASSGGCHVAEYNGKVAFFGDLQQSPNLIGIYELRDGGSTPTPPTPTNENTIQLPRESEIVWSNCLDKGMYLDHVSINVLLNSADNPEGITVDFINLNEYEQQNYPIDQLVLDETGYYEFDAFRRGDYAINIRREGYYPIDDTVAIYENMDLRYVMIEILYGVENVYVSRTGWAMWDDSHNLPSGGSGGGGGQSGNGDTFSYDFDNGMPSDWTTIDADGDGLTWVSSMTPGVYHNSGVSLSGTGHNASEAYVISGSYANQTGQVLYPDNYLVSPRVNIVAGSTFSFWACAQDANYAAEHYGVSVSDNGTDWTLVQEWTMTAKSGGMTSVGRDGNNRAQGNWYQKTVDLSAYTGQKYIAIRHFNCYDQFILNVDDVELTAGAKSEQADRHFEHYKILCTSIDGVPIYNHNTVHPFCQLTTDGPYVAPLVEGEHYLCKVAAVYSTGQSEWSEPVEWEYEPCDHWGPVDEVTVNTTNQGNHIEWVFEHGYNPYGGDTPGPGPGAGDAFSVDFESGMPEGWTVIDANNDGWTWCLTSAIPSTWTYYAGMTLDWYHNGTNAICSGSYINGVGALTPDEYFVSPQVSLGSGSQLSFWVAATDASYAADHFGVFVSTTGTNPSDFQSVQEWTLTAKKEGMAGGSASRNGEGLRLGNWYNYTVDLSAYAGQAYIAFRHFNCTDMYIMCLDDIELTSGAKGYNAMNSGMLSNGTYAFNITDIANFDERVYFLYNLNNDVRFDVINGEAAGMFIVSAAAGYEDMDLEEAVIEFSDKNANEFAMMDKVQAADVARAYKSSLPMSFTNSMMMDIYAKSRDNAHCADAYPFCTDEGMYEFPAGVNAGSGESGPDYDCLYTQPNPAWYYMKMYDPGDMDIYMYSTPSVDIDFCCWGPFTDPISPCPNGLTEDKVVSCSYSAAPTEHCMIPATAQTGEYYILVITNYSNQACNINFSKVGGSGSTDCSIVVPTADLLGFLITQDGEYLAFAGPDDREYTDIDEFGIHEYCVRPIYPGTMILPDHNYGWSMGCPVCEFSTGGEPGCAAGAPIHSEQVNGDHIKVWWGEQPHPGISEWLYYDDGVNTDAIGLTSGGSFYWGIMFPASSLAPYDGTSLTKVAYFDYTAHTGTIRIFQGGTTAPATQVYTQAYTANGSGDWIEWTLTTPVQIDVTQNLWVVLNNNDGQYVAACGNDTGDPNGRWISTDGASWFDLAEAGLNDTWNLRAFVTNEAKGGEAHEIAFEPKGTANAELSHTGIAKYGNFAPMMQNRADIVSYKVYRSTDNDNYSFLDDVPAAPGQTYYEYIDAPGTAGTYYYQVRALYDDGCESEPAQAAEDPNHNYVTGTCDGLNENSDNVALFPNPTNGNVTIQAQGMSHITVVSVLGQVVYDTDLNADEFTLNMGQFNAGMYMVRVYTGSGVTVKRVTVMQ